MQTFPIIIKAGKWRAWPSWYHSEGGAITIINKKKMIIGRRNK